MLNKAYFLFEKFRIQIHSSFLVCLAKYMITETQHDRTFLAQTQVSFWQFL